MEEAGRVSPSFNLSSDMKTRRSVISQASTCTSDDNQFLTSPSLVYQPLKPYYLISCHRGHDRTYHSATILAIIHRSSINLSILAFLCQLTATLTAHLPCNANAASSSPSSSCQCQPSGGFWTAPDAFIGFCLPNYVVQTVIALEI